MTKVILADCRNGRCVRVGARWGVVCEGSPLKTNCIVDFWDGGRERVAPTTVVEVLA